MQTRGDIIGIGWREVGFLKEFLCEVGKILCATNDKLAVAAEGRV